METYSSIYQTQVEGYTYSYADPESFTPDGMGTPVEVTLYYTQNAPEQVNSTVTVHHVDAQTSQPITGDTTAGSRRKHGDLFLHLPDAGGRAIPTPMPTLRALRRTAWARPSR